MESIWNDSDELDMLRSTQGFIVAAPHCASRAFRSLAVQVFGDFEVPLWKLFLVTF